MIMRRLLTIFTLSFILLSCQDIERPEKPDNLIDRDIMVNILVDTYVSNAARNQSFQKIQDENVRLEKYIYQKYDIDSLQFAKSNAYYSSNMEDYIKILKEVEQEIMVLKGDSIEEEPSSKTTKDSDPEDSDI